MASLASWRAALEEVRNAPLTRDTPGQRKLRKQWVSQVERLLKQGSKYESMGIEVVAPKVSVPKVFSIRSVRSLAETRYVGETVGPNARTRYKAMRRAQRRVAKAWNAQRRRIMLQIMRMQSRGYTVDIDKLRLDPPKLYTWDSVRRLKNIKADQLYKFATYRDPRPARSCRA